MSDPVELVRSIIEGLERGNPQPLLQTLSDRVEWNEAENGPYWAGAALLGGEAIMTNVFARIQQDFQDLRLTVRRVVGCGNTVLVEGRYSAVSKANGQSLDAQVAHIWDFEDGKVIRWQQYTDTWQFAKVTGTSPKQTPNSGGSGPRV